MFRRYLVILILMISFTLLLPSATLAADMGAIVKIGQNISIPADETLDTVIAIGGDVNLEGKVKDAIVAIGGNATINGEVGDTVVVIGGKAEISKEIQGDLVVIGTSAKLAPGAVINGEVIIIGGNLTKDEGAEIKGAQTEIDISNFFTNFSFFGISLAAFLLGLVFIGSLLMALLILFAGLIFPRGLKNSQQFFLDSPAKAFFIGLMLAIFFLPISFVLLITIIGIPLLLLFWLIYGVMVIWGSAALASLLGEKVTGLVGYKGNSTVLQLIVGIVLLFITAHIPFIGWLGILIIKILALGISVVSHLGFREF